MKAIFFLRAWRPTVEISMLSISIEPSSSSQRRKSVWRIDDFPAPVRPTMPTFIFGRIVMFRFLMLGSRVFLYLIVTFLNWMFPLVGHPPDYSS